MFKNRNVAIMLSLFAFSFSTVASAAFIECHDCSQTEINQKALTWTLANISEREAINHVEKIVHVIDMSKIEVQSFQVRRKALPSPPTGNLNHPRKINYVADFDKISPPRDVVEKLNDIKRAKADLQAETRRLVIPKDVISDPWEFVNCGYCRATVQNYFNDALSGQITILEMSIRTLAETFGVITGALSEQYRINLEAGGYITFHATLINNTSELNIEIKEVVDSDGNTIPLKASDLPGLSIKINDPTRGAIINSYLQRFNFAVPINTKGIVIITDCVNNAQHACKGQ